MIVMTSVIIGCASSANIRRGAQPASVASYRDTTVMGNVKGGTGFLWFKDKREKSTNAEFYVWAYALGWDDALAKPVRELALSYAKEMTRSGHIKIIKEQNKKTQGKVGNDPNAKVTLCELYFDVMAGE